jgi:hypothetical protein
MHVLPRRLALLLAGSAAAAALAVPMAGQADAATSVVRLHTQANTGHFLSNVSGSAFSPFASSSDDRQRWIKTDKVNGFAEFRNFQDQSVCLDRPPLTNGGSLIGKFLSVRACNGSTSQQWKINPSGDFQQRSSGLIAQVDLANVNQAVKLAQIPLGALLPEQKWHTHAA